MSFKIKDKTFYLSLVGVISVILTITFSVMVFIDSATYGETMKNVVLIVIGFYFNHEKNYKGSEKSE